ncbi:MAG: hypothetical protein JWM35_988, partial [Verrucomicrobia bacterium]|nr:hypothetical protein [Verrucomicrobiota bacterium]
VFAGNVSDTKPAEIKGLDGLPIEASKTTATAAGRAIDDVAKEYAERHNLNNAYDDLDWMGNQCREITNEELEEFLQKQK